MKTAKYLILLLLIGFNGFTQTQHQYDMHFDAEYNPTPNLVGGADGYNDIIGSCDNFTNFKQIEYIYNPKQQQ